MTCAGAAVTLGPANEPPVRIELMPTGAFTLRDRAGQLGAINAKVSDLAALIERFLANATSGMLPIDFAHGMDDLGARDGRAAGWITGLTNIPALPELKQVASRAEAAQFAEFAKLLGMPSDTAPKDILTAIGAAL